MHEIKLRLRFEKTGRAIYSSHLDLMRTMQRAFLRAGLPLKYSEGFNPHALISIILPLPLGMESECELMDFRLSAPLALSSIPERLNPALPEGIRALDCYEAIRKGRELKWLGVEGRFEYDGLPLEQAADELRDFFARPSIVIEKRTKRGTGEMDIVPAIAGLGFEPEGGCVRVRATVSAQEPTLSPEQLINALKQLKPELAPDFARFRRLEALDSNMLPFK